MNNEADNIEGVAEAIAGMKGKSEKGQAKIKPLKTYGKSE